MKIKVLVKQQGCMPQIIDKGEWIDLHAATTVSLGAPELASFSKIEHTAHFKTYAVSLGVAMKLPAGFEALVVPRSSTFKKYGVIQANAVGIIDNSYSGNDDVWRMPLIALRETKIPKGTRIAQFRIQLSQKATVWQKLCWLFSRKIELVQVETLDAENRGGFGSTGD